MTPRKRRIAEQEFKARPPWWGGDLQTLRNFFVGWRLRQSIEDSERLYLPLADGSGDKLTAAFTSRTGKKPLVILIHGLTGCEESANVLRSAAFYLRHGFPVLRLNLRAAGPSRATCETSYHAGASQDLAQALTAMDDEMKRFGIFFSAVSLGANMLIKFLAEYGHDFPIVGAAATSAPIDLADSCRQILRPRNALYQHYLLKRMKADTLGLKLKDSERQGIHAARTIYEFDDNYVAPRFGFESAEHYYEESMARRYLDQVPVPTLVTHAANDPWIPIAPYLDFDWSYNDNLTPCFTRTGGHVGFHAAGNADCFHDRQSLKLLNGIL